MRSSLRILALTWLTVFCFGRPSGWREDVSRYLNGGDYRGAYSSVSSRFDEIPLTDKATAAGLLAYTAGMSGEREREMAWIRDYYETYRGGVYILDFLEPRLRARLVDYFQAWDRIYPRITELGLIRTDEFSGTSPPRRLLLGLEIENPALYKLREGRRTIEGGLFNRGFNTISLEAGGFFDRSAVHSYVLEIKADDLVVSRGFDLDVVVEAPEASVQSGAISSNIEYTLSLFLGETLLATGRKTHEDRVAMKLDFPPGPDKFEPFKVPGQDDPSLHNFSIFDAIAGITDLIKTIGKDRDETTPVPPVRLSSRLEMEFIRPQAEAGTTEVRAVITLKQREIPPAGAERSAGQERRSCDPQRVPG